MPGTLANTGVAVVGGDLRQLAVAETLARLGAVVKIYGLPAPAAGNGITAAVTLREALAGSAVVILPISGANPAGRVTSLPGQPSVYLVDDFWGALEPRTLIVAGSLPADARQRAAAAGHRVIEYAEIDEIAVLNSIPTAEGALQLALEGLPITIHGSCVLVLGLGRVGQTTARLFKAVGAETLVAANRPALRARALEMGCRTLTFAELPAEIGRADLIINTVPALVLTGELLALTKPAVCVIDLASAPGGVDFQAAENLGRRTNLALGLPGKVAPESAGRILASTLPAIIAKELA